MKQLSMSEKNLFCIQDNESLCESNMFLNNILNAAGDPFFVKDEESKFVFVNDALCTMLGIARENILGKTLGESLPEDQMKHFLKIDKLVLESGEENQCEELLTGKDGKIRTIVTKKTRYVNEHGKKLLIGVIHDITIHKQTEERLKDIEWMLTPKLPPDKGPPTDTTGNYGDLTELNVNGIILKSVGQELLREVAEDYLGLLGTSSAIYEVNGDYAFGIFASRWCQTMDRASRKLCDTSDNIKALNSGRWLCHESCWTNCARIAIAECRPVDIECNGGIRMYCEPIKAGDKVVGAINFGYGDPPQEKAKLQKLANDYNIQYDDLLAETKTYQSRPLFIIEQAKKRLHATARLIGSMVEQKQTELVLRAEKKRAVESEMRFKALHNASFGGIVIHDKGLILDCNQGLSEITGYSQQELIGMDGLLLIATQSRQWVMDHILAGYDKPYEAVGVRKDGREYPVRLEGRQIPYHGKEVRVVEFRDITNQKQAEEALRESENRLQKIFDILPIGLWFADKTGKLLRGNPAGVSIWGAEPRVDPSRYGVFKARRLPSGEEIGSDDWALTHTIREGTTTLDEVLEIDSFDGQKKIILNFTAPVLDDNGAILGAVIVNQDITERKQAEEVISAERERLAVTLRSIGDGVITTDINGTIVLMNKVAEELCGWKQNEAQGKPLSSVFNIINQSTREPHESPVAKVLASGQIIELANHTLLISRDGTERLIADSGAPIKDRDSKTIGVVLVFRDMTEKKKLESALEVSSKLESLAVLAGGIAHDFNNLLGGIYGYIDMAIESAKDVQTAEFLSKTVSTIDRARALTQQLLTFAKGGAPVQKIAPLFPFVQETAQFALSGTNVSCDFNIQQDLWNCNYDRNQIGQVIDNLIINAQQAMPVGGSINVSAQNVSLSEKEHPLLSEGNYVKISVKDSGVGIKKELLVRIFDPFFTTKTKGHGLGLATCYSIINRHGGCIDVDSELGKGSIFHVYLPATDTQTSEIVIQQSAQHKGSGTFLVMDDEEVMRDILKQLLESFGYSVICRDNGKDALAFLTAEMEAKRPVAGMIFDLTVPGGMGGMEAVAELRKIDAKTPVFVASGYADGTAMKNPVEYGFTASIGKPFRKAELIEMLEKYMKTGT